MSNKIVLVLAFVIAMNLQAWTPLRLKRGYSVNVLVLQDNDGNDNATPVEIFIGKSIADAKNKSESRFLQVNVYDRSARSPSTKKKVHARSQLPKKLSVPLQDNKNFPLLTGYVSRDLKLYLLYFSNNDFHLYRHDEKSNALVLLFNSFEHWDNYYTVTLSTQTDCVISNVDTREVAFDSDAESQSKDDLLREGNYDTSYDLCSIL
ncbi:hypothetical protein M1466_02950 [Candidatus Dependentiae bacterium]|nr:hypothetical protein [Candidatus Dependentiae bacterium]